jgi:hypothetical protein
MDNDRITRRTLPQVYVGVPLSLLRWVDEQAERAGTSRSAWILALIERERAIAVAVESDGHVAEAVPS